MVAKDPYPTHQPTWSSCYNKVGTNLLAALLWWGSGLAIAAISAPLTEPSVPFEGLLIADETNTNIEHNASNEASSERVLTPPGTSDEPEQELAEPDSEQQLEETPLEPGEAVPPVEDPAAEGVPPEANPGTSPDPAYTAPLPLPDQELDPPLTLPPIQTTPYRPPSAPRAPFPGFQEPPEFDTYRLGPGDAIFVNVRQFPDLSFQATLDIQGNIIVPLQGVTSLNGLTLQETEELIRQIYDQYVIEPDVSLTLIAQRGVEVTILGEVARPGYYPLASPQIAAALLSAGGTTGQADLREVQIQRQLPSGEMLEQTVDLFTPLKEGQELPDVSLQDGDVILVERLDPAELDEYDRDLVSRSTLAEPVITVRLLNYGSGSLGGATSGSLTAIDLPNGSRFSDALIRANLNPDTSDLGQIALVRFDEEAGQAVTTTLDGNDAFRGMPSENPPLQDNDVIVVNRTLLAKVTYALNTFTQPFRDVLGFLLFFDQLAESTESLFGP